MISEPDVALTDRGLAVECAILARLIAGTGGHAPARNHDALYHVVQGVGLLLIYRGPVGALAAGTGG